MTRLLFHYSTSLFDWSFYLLDLPLPPVQELSLPTVSFSLSMSFVGMLAISAWIDVVTAHTH